MTDYRLDPPDLIQCPECGEELYPDPGKYCTCGWVVPDFDGYDPDRERDLREDRLLDAAERF